MMVLQQKEYYGVWLGQHSVLSAKKGDTTELHMWRLAQEDVMGERSEDSAPTQRIF